MIYVHIPFCASKCAYCDFYSRPVRSGSEAEDYVSTVIREWSMRRDEVPGPITTIYIGGGTPSLLPQRQLDRLLAQFPDRDLIEVTLEANPEQITPDFISWIENSPVNRLSVGIQSFDDSQLKFVGRRHTSSDALRAIELIENSSINNYSLDLIYGLPGQDIDSWKQSLGTLLAYNPPHFSAYMLSYEPRTRLDAMRIAGKIKPSDDDMLSEMYTLLCDEAAKNGYKHYEISNFALPGMKAVHNTNYWLNKPYVGLGAAAYSFDGKIRRYNPSDLRRYMAMTDTPVYETEYEDSVARHNNLLLTSLRISEGLDLTLYEKEFGTEALCRLLNLSSNYIRRNMMQLEPGHFLKITETGWLMTDTILVDLFEE